MIAPNHIPTNSASNCGAFKTCVLAILACVLSVFLSACATTSITPPSQIESHPRAITIPYKVSEAGHLIIDVAVNGRTARPFIIDSGANASAVYEDYTTEFGLEPTGKTTSVSGLVATALRPLSGSAALQIGSQTFQRDRIIILETPPNSNDVVGLLGVDVLSDYTVLFNKETAKATFIPSTDIDRKAFAGWHRIALRNHVGDFPDKGLYFATIQLKGWPAPVLIDTGSSINFVNWELATKDEAVAKLQRYLRKSIQLQGAIDDVPLRRSAIFYDVQLGTKQWPEVDVVILEFDTLNEIAPVDRPMMLAGVNFFSPSTFAFDFGDNAIYILKDQPVGSSREIQGEIVDVSHRASRLSK